MKPRIAILASGGGTTAEAFIRAAQAGEISSEVVVVIISRENAGIFERIENLNREYGLNIPAKLISPKNYPAEGNEEVKKGFLTRAEEAAMLQTLEEYKPDLIALMGYMKHIGPKLIEAYGWLPNYTSVYQAKMVNTHPGLLPDTKAMYGEQIQAYVLEHKLPYGGQTLHLVSAEYDDGPIIAEHRVDVEPGDTPPTLFDRVQATEKKYLPGDIEAFVKARIAYTKT